MYPGVDTPLTPVEPDVLDAGDVVESVGVVGLAAGCRVRRVGSWLVVAGGGVSKNCQV